MPYFNYKNFGALNYMINKFGKKNLKQATIYQVKKICNKPLFKSKLKKLI
jgi:hypothetical protein